MERVIFFSCCLRTTLFSNRCQSRKTFRYGVHGAGISGKLETLKRSHDAASRPWGPTTGCPWLVRLARSKSRVVTVALCCFLLWGLEGFSTQVAACCLPHPSSNGRSVVWGTWADLSRLRFILLQTQVLLRIALLGELRQTGQATKIGMTHHPQRLCLKGSAARPLESAEH